MTQRTRINLADAVDDLAPPPPPCFHNATAWRQYLKSAAAHQHAKGEQKVILVREHQEPAFNPRFNFCADCETANRRAMSQVGRCKPDHIKTEAKPKTQKEAAIA